MLTYGFYDSINSDRRYYPYQLLNLFRMLMPDGVCSGIGNGFACQVKDKRTIKVRSGLCFFNGYYVYNDEEFEYSISEEVYPAPSLSGITVDEPPIQTEYPAGNKLDLTGISVLGIKSNVSISSIKMENLPQSDYPYGNKLDLGNIKIVGDLVAVEENRIGDCYIVLEFDPSARTFDIKAININDYREEVHQLLTVCHKTVDGLRCENVIGRTIDEFIKPTKWITGLFQAILIDDIMTDIVYDEEHYLDTFDSEKSAFWNSWLDNNEYILYHLDGAPSQYSRLTDELSTKETKPIIVYDTITKETTDTSIYVPNMPSDAKISFKINPYGLVVTKLDTIGSNYIRVSHSQATRNYSICLIIR